MTGRGAGRWACFLLTVILLCFSAGGLRASAAGDAADEKISDTAVYPDAGNILTATLARLDDRAESEQPELINTDCELKVTENYRLRKLIGNFEEKGYSCGFVMIDLATGAALVYDPMLRVYSASAIKAPYIFSLLESGIEPDDNMYAAGHWSDNAAYTAIRKKYGSEVFGEWLDKVGVQIEEYDRHYCHLTAQDLSRMWLWEYRYLARDGKNSEWIRNTFSDAVYSAADLFLPAEYTVYSKAGWISSAKADYNVYNVGGIVLVPSESSGKDAGSGAAPEYERGYILAFVSSAPWDQGYALCEDLFPVLNDISAHMAGAN